VRYTSNGALDATFGTGGKVTTEFGTQAQGFSSAAASDIALRLDGKIAVTGRAYFNGDYRSALAQYTTSGTLDTGFATAGKAAIIFGGDTDGVSSLAVQPDGKIVVAGGVSVDWLSDFALARFN